MDPGLAWTFEWLSRFGPLVILLATFAETAFVTGLVVPAGVMTAMAAFLASQGALDVGGVLVAASVGGGLGDSCGFWLGRKGKARATWPVGAGAWQRYGGRASLLFQRNPIFAVTLARLVSFVRTLMPVVAGSSNLTYVRFLAYEIPGVLVYAVGYVAVGYLAGESWHTVSTVMGTGWAVLFTIVALGLWVASRIRARRRFEARTDEPSDNVETQIDEEASP